MADQTTSRPASSGDTPPPEFVSAEEYMEKYAEQGYEWVNGRLFKLNEPPPDIPPRMVIDADEYMAHYAHDFYEWVNGELIKMSPVSGVHNLLTGYLFQLLVAYFALRPIAQIRYAPFVMHVESTSSKREPDLQIILNTNPGQLTPTRMDGPADICIEVVSPESVERDYGTKLVEYEAGGVKEYWLLDPNRKRAVFNRLNAEKAYEAIAPNADGDYVPPLLPDFKLNVPTLWAESLPDFYAIAEMVKAMVKG